MIVEERIYTLYPGKVPAFLKAYEQYGLEIQRSILGTLVGYFHTEFGPQNQIVHMWAYRDLADRIERRARLASDPGWAKFREISLPMILTQENKLLIPASFSPYGQ